MKKLITLLMVAALLLGLCGSALAYGPDDPIHIPFWHTRGSGANGAVLTESVERFNETVGKEKGIIIDAVFQGSYADNVTKMQLASQSIDETYPVVGVTSSAHTAMLLDDGLTADMAPFMAETGFDLNQFVDSLLNVPAIHDGEVHTLPYVRSTPVFYYNKTMADAKGLKAPETVADMEEFCKALYVPSEVAGEEPTTYGFEFYEDTSFNQGAFLLSQGAGFAKINEDGTTSSPCLDEGSLLKLFSDWRRWVDEGWCRPYDSSSAGTAAQQRFYQGKIASLVASCGSMGNIAKYSAEAGFELGVCMIPYYTERAVGIGGGNLILLEGNSEERLRAGWEFIQFLLSPEQIAKDAMTTGYVPTLKNMEENETMKAFWAENPNYKVAYDQLPYGTGNETPYVPERMEFMNIIKASTSLLIQEQSITAEEAFEQVKADSAHLFN